MNFVLSHPAEFKVVSTAVFTFSSEPKSFKNLINPSPPVSGDTPETWADTTGTNFSALAASPKSIKSLIAFCLVGPCPPSNISSCSEFKFINLNNLPISLSYQA